MYFDLLSTFVFCIEACKATTITPNELKNTSTDSPASSRRSESSCGVKLVYVNVKLLSLPQFFYNFWFLFCIYI